MNITKFHKYFCLEDRKYLLINTLNGAIDIVEDDVISYLNEPKNSVIDEKTLIQLKARGYINSDGDDERQLKKLIKNFYEHGKNINFTICPSYLCNLRCKYCFESLEVRTQGKVLGINEVDKVFEAIKAVYESKNMKKATITLYGGEPFLPSTKQIIPYIFEKALMENYALKAISNGTNLSLFRSELENYKDRFQQIQVTLDGPKEIHDSLRVKADNSSTFDQIVESINMLIDIGIHVSLRINTGKDNVDMLPKIIELISINKWNKVKNFSCQLAPITDHYCTNCAPNWIPESELLIKIYNVLGDFERIRKEYRVSLGTDMERRTRLIRSIWDRMPTNQSKPNPSPCGAGARTFYVFGAEGNIYPCPETVGMEEYAIGRYIPEFFIDPEKEKVWDRNVANIAKCQTCNIAGLCGSGCTWAHIATHGKNFDEPVCNYALDTIMNFININRHRILKMVE